MDGRIGAEHVRGKTVLTRLFSTYPLRLIPQQPWLNYASVVALGFGGGLVHGDRVDLQLRLKAGALVCLKTQGSQKVFKSHTLPLPLSSNAAQTGKEWNAPGDGSGVTSTNSIRALLQTGSLFAMLLDPTVCFPGARYRQQLDFRLQEGASLLYVDWFTAGRTDRDEDWAMERLQNDVFVGVGERIVLVERLDLRSSEAGSIGSKVGHLTVFGSVVMVGPKTEALRRRLQALQQRQTFHQRRAELLGGGADDSPREASAGLASPPLVSVSDLDEDSCILRFALHSVEEGYELLAEVLRPLEGVMPGCAPYADRLLRAGPAPALAASHAVSLLRQYDQEQSALAQAALEQAARHTANFLPIFSVDTFSCSVSTALN
ncbi:UreD urease accessory protein-domain-containing protein [Ochromonadaceae sp. CCMP2298]|nr:UreD urease accessory protein-domain-containing protein [Ochromonadaceae sp. CCMP2298]